MDIINGKIIIETEDDLSEIINKTLVFVIKNKPKKLRIQREKDLIVLYENDKYISQSNYEWYLNNKTLIFTNIVACENFLKEEEKAAVCKNFNASEIGFFEKNGLCVEYIAKGCLSSRNIIAKFKVKSSNLNRIDLSTEAQSSYFQKELDTLTDEQKDNTKFVNNFVAKLYYEIIL